MYVFEILPLNAGFKDDDENNTFGCLKKGIYMPQSNFAFEFVTEVICQSWPQSSGFLVKVKAEGSSLSRCFYTGTLHSHHFKNRLLVHRATKYNNFSYSL